MAMILSERIIKQVVREDLKKRLGTDLTIPDAANKLYHTGCAPDMFKATSILSHRPHEFLWRVGDGVSAGAGRTKLESWNKYVDRFIAERLWFHRGD